MYDDLTLEQRHLVANTIRMLAVDGVEKANSGHPGMPMGMADLATAVWLKYLRFNSSDPKWCARDRFVLSNGHGSMLLYSLLHLAGFDLTLNDLMNFRQWESRTPGHPESYMTAGVECTTGPLGQGISNAVGIAIGQKLLSARYGKEAGLDYRVVTFAGDGCLMEGVSSEASSIAGHLGLGNLKVIYDDNHISIAGHTELAFTEDVCKRYEAYGWNVLRADGHDFASIDAALAAAFAEQTRPTLIAARTFIGKGSPNKVDTHGVHGAPLGKEEIAKTRAVFNWPDKDFYIPEEVTKIMAARKAELKAEYDKWQTSFSGWKAKEPEKATRLEAQLSCAIPADLEDKLVAALPKDGKPMATRQLSQEVIQAAAKAVDSLIGGSADLEPSTLTLIKGESDVQRNAFTGRNLRFGVREHGMGAIMNGLAYNGGYIPYGSTFLCFADYMRPTLRLAALSHLPGLFIFTHDSVFLGEDGPTHQPIEHLNSLRMIPNLWVLRPADGLETAMCYSIGIRRKDGPVVLVFTRQNLPQIERKPNFDREVMRKGAYVAYERGGVPSIVFVATGSEVSLATQAAMKLDPSVAMRVVSMPCCELYRKQDAAYRESLVPKNAKVVVIEAGTSFGWSSILETTPENFLAVTIDHFGASAPASVIAEKFGFTPDAVAKKVQERFL